MLNIIFTGSTNLGTYYNIFFLFLIYQFIFTLFHFKGDGLIGGQQFLPCLNRTILPVSYQSVTNPTKFLYCYVYFIQCQYYLVFYRVLFVVSTVRSVKYGIFHNISICLLVLFIIDVVFSVILPYLILFLDCHISYIII